MNPDQQEVVLALSRVSRELDEMSLRIADLDATSTHAWSVHRQTYAEAFLSETGPMDVRKQKAVLAAEDARLAAETADQVLRAARERIRVLRDRLDVGRSMNAAVRSQFAAEGVGQP